MNGYYELKPSGDQFMFNLKAGNHEIILTSERYVSKANAEKGIASVQKNSPDDFSLTATNGQSIGRSEMYSSTSAMENGIASVKKNGPTTTIKDLTA